MRPSLKRLGVPLIAALVTGGLGANPATGSSAEAEQPSRQLSGTRQQPTSKSVTLITGDRVVVSGKDDVGITPGKGRRHITFHTHRKAGKVRVIPSDAEILVASGRLDPRLFDITGLVEDGYDDSITRSLPLIVTYDGAAGAASVRNSGAETVRALPSINGSAVRITKGKNFLASLPVTGQRIAGGIERVWLDGKRRVLLDQSVPQIGAPAAWGAGYTGSGVIVAVLDTGVDATHPDLAGQVVESRNFTSEPDGDQVGHGTHVASTIAGTAAASNGKYRGVAPDAKLLDGKVCGSWDCPESAILAGMQWAATENRADVVNLSLGGPDGPGIDPLEEAVNTLTAQTGSLFVIAAGNDGPGGSTVTSPGSADAALTVGAVNKSDRIAPFSGRGPRIGDAGVKPDLTAPGVDIVAAKAKDTEMGPPVGEHYVRSDGTSMATPHAAGAAALLVQQRPDRTPAEVKAALMASASKNPGLGLFDQGTGRVDLAKAITQSIIAIPGSLSFGTAVWPHDDDEPVVRQLTYRNTGNADITLALTTSLTAPGGDPAPDGALTLSTTSLTVPAGRTASVTVTSTTTHGGPDGIYTGRVDATGPADVSVSVPLSVDVEPERYDLTVTHLDRDGQPTGTGTTRITGLDNDTLVLVRDSDGSTTIRVPKGRYFIEGYVGIDRGNDQYEMHSLMQPALAVDRDTTLTVDARRTRPVDVRVPRPDAVLDYYTQAGVMDLGDSIIGGGITTFMDNALFTAPLGEPSEQFSALLSSVWGAAGENGLVMVNSPYMYHLMNTQKGQYWNGFDRTVQDSELAAIPVQHHWSGRNEPDEKLLHGHNPDGFGLAAGSNWYRPPAGQTQLVEAGGNKWRGVYLETDPDTMQPELILEGHFRGYSAGRHPAERWNAAAIGPGMQPFPNGIPTARRVGDRVIVYLPNYSDGDGHVSRWFGASTPGSAKLYCNGEPIENWPNDPTVPSGSCNFRHVVSTGRNNRAFTTRIEMDSTFSSETASEEGEPLPMWAVRYHPRVDMRNAMKRSPLTVLPVELEPQPGADVGTMAKVEVHASGDDGATWTKATVQPSGNNRYLAVFATPAGQFISLKAKAADSDGNTTAQTLVRAYALR